MANARTVLPEMISVSRNCPLTRDLHQILSEKLEGYDFEVLHRWLQIVEQEIELKKHKARNNFKF